MYIGREWMMTPFNKESFSAHFESMSIKTQFSDSSNEANVYLPYVRGYGQSSQNYVMGSSSTDEKYGMFSYSPFYTNVIPHSISDTRTIWHEHMDEPWISYPCRGSG